MQAKVFILLPAWRYNNKINLNCPNRQLFLHTAQMVSFV